MKILLLIAGVLVLALLIVYLVGRSLPQSHTASRTAHYQQPPDVVWEAITDWTEFPNWRSDVKSVEAWSDSDGAAGWVEVQSYGDRLPMKIEAAEPPLRLVLRIADPNLPFGGTWTYRLTPNNSGCDLQITEDGEVYNPFFRFISRFFMGHHGSIDAYLKALGTKFGETVVLQ